MREAFKSQEIGGKYILSTVVREGQGVGFVKNHEPFRLIDNLRINILLFDFYETFRFDDF